MGVSAKPWSRTALFFCTYIIGGCAALGCQRGPAACGPTWVLSQRHSYALCVTPKIGCSELLEFVRWLELPSEEYCGLHMSSKLRLEAVEEKCAASLVGTAKANAALDCHIQPWRRARDRPNGTFTGCRDAYGTFRGNGLCIEDSWGQSGRRRTSCPEHLSFASMRRFVVVRDPWERLMSGFADKYYNQRKNLGQYLPAFDRQKASLPPLERLMLALLATPDAQSEIHFRTQSNLCLAESQPWDYVAILGRDASSAASIDGMAQLMSAGAKNLSQVALGPYTEKRRIALCFNCSSGVVSLIKRLRDERFAKDIEALGRLHPLGAGHFSFAFDQAIQTCASRGRICHRSDHLLAPPPPPPTPPPPPPVGEVGDTALSIPSSAAATAAAMAAYPASFGCS